MTGLLTHLLTGLLTHWLTHLLTHSYALTHLFMFTSKGNVDVVPPSRIVTIFVYLNTMPEGEGYTEFPHLGLTIRPEKCSAIMFCNFLPNG